MCDQADSGALHTVAGFGEGLSKASPLILDDVDSAGPSDLACLVKRGLDVVIAATALVALSLLLVLLAVAVASDGGPVFYAHKRIGRFGRTFACLKFRSMRVDSQAALAELLARDPAAAAEWAETQKLRVDPRVTSVGRLLRVTSLDELPQLVNVLRGEMSLVGPRPIVEAEIVRYGAAFRHYLSVRPGLTGLWQISGRTDVSYNQRVRLDAEYAQGWSVRMDMLIMLKTIPAVLLRRGAA